MGMVDRVFLLSLPRFYFENLKFFIEILLKNDYPLKSIFNTVANQQLIYDKIENVDISQCKLRKNNTLYERPLTSLKI